MVEIFIPSGPKPSRGWPVALMGHGITSSMYEDAWAIAPQLAAVGIATAAIHFAGHGGGERGTLEVVSRDGRVVLVSSGGRGIDQDGDGRISPLEGLYAISPQAIVFDAMGPARLSSTLCNSSARSSWRRRMATADGLDATRISYVGQSGAQSTARTVAIERRLALALNVGGGPSVDIYRLGSDCDNSGGAIAARTPSLQCAVAEDPAKPSFAFIDNIPRATSPSRFIDPWGHGNPAAVSTACRGCPKRQTQWLCATCANRPCRDVRRSRCWCSSRATGQ
jgi:hypothetical protein